jgi:hypothetical protein
MRIINSVLSLAALWTGCTLPATAAEIYRWIDADGTIHYSDEKPRDDKAFTTLEFADTRPRDYDPIEDPYSIQNQAQRINESWTTLAEAREKRIEDRRQAAQNAQLSDQNAYRQRLEYGTRYFSPWFYSTRAPLYYQRRVDQGTAQRQIQAIQGLQLAGPRPASINSGVHRERVQRSAALPVSGTAPRRRQ